MYVFIYSRKKVVINVKVRIMDNASEIQILDYLKSTVNRTTDSDVTICRYNIIVNFFDVSDFFCQV